MVFHRHILLQVTIPAVLVGLGFLAVCLIGIGSINRLQRNRVVLLTRNVRSLQAAQEMEVRLRQLHLHSVLYVMNPSPTRRAAVEQAHHQYLEAYRRALEAAHLPKERELLEKIEASYRLYRAALEQTPPTSPGKNTEVPDLLRWADAHPVRRLLDVCEELVQYNRVVRARLTEESEVVSDQGRTALLLAGVLGPIGGLISDFGVAWGLSRSMTRISVRLRDIHAELDQEVGSVRLAGGELSQIDLRLEYVLQRVRDVVARVQEQQQEVLRAEQLAAVGQLAASIAHEVRNPLTSIKLLVSAALRARPAQTLTPEDLHVIHDEVSRLERKVQTLLDFARPPETERRPCDLRQIVQRSLDLVQAARSPARRANRSGSARVARPGGRRRRPTRERARELAPQRPGCHAPGRAIVPDLARFAGCDRSLPVSRGRHGPRHRRRRGDPAVHPLRQHQADRDRPGPEHLPARRPGPRRHAIRSQSPGGRGLLHDRVADLSQGGCPCRFCLW